MRNSIVIAVSIASSLALTACGNSHHEGVKAKVAAAKVTGDTKKQKANFDEIARDIEAKRVELRHMGFHRADDHVTDTGLFFNFKDNLAGRSEQKRQAIDAKLNEMNELADQMVVAAKDLKDQGKVAHAQKIKQVIAYAQDKNKVTVLDKKTSQAFAAVVSVAPTVWDWATWPHRQAYGLMKMGYTKVVGEAKPYSAKFAEVKNQIDAKVQQLNQVAYHEQDEQYSATEIVNDAKSIFKSRSADEVAKIKAILEEIQTDSAELTKVAGDDQEKAVANYVSSLAKSNLADIEKAQKKQQKNAIKAQQRQQRMDELKNQYPAIYGVDQFVGQ